MSHNAEADAIDLLIELDSLALLVQYVDSNTYQRACLYLLGCCAYLTPPDDVNGLRVVHDIYLAQSQWSDAVNIALKLRDVPLVTADFNKCTEPLVRKQIAFQLARAGVVVECDELLDILSNTALSSHFLTLARDLDVVEPKSPEDVYKAHLENSRLSCLIQALPQRLIPHVRTSLLLL